MIKNTLIMIIAIFNCSNVLSQELDLSSEKTNYYLAIKGGVSLGSYETGINRAILKYVERNKQDVNLVSFSGASAGSVNSVLSAIDTCVIDKKIEYEEIGDYGIKRLVTLDDSLVSNFMQEAWDIGIDDLVPTEENHNNYKSLYKYSKKQIKEDVAIFSRKAFDNKKKLIESLIKKSNIGPDCNLTITMSVTKFDPHEVDIKELGAKIQLQRFVIPIDVTASNDSIIFKNSKNSAFSHKEDQLIPQPYLKLVENSKGEVPFSEIWKLAMASSAFPFAFHPVELTFCFAHETKKDGVCSSGEASTALFSDGGLFDNSPIGVAWDIANSISLPEKNSKTKLIYINPDSYRSIEEKVIPVRNKQNIGVSEYIDYFSDSFLTAHESEYTVSLKNILDTMPLKGNRVFYTTSRYHHLLADLHFHFGAFYAKEYRVHDYLVGVYDGANITAQLDCDKDEYSDRNVDRFEKGYRECVRERVLSWINNLPVPEPSTKDISAIEFIKYLYDTEYDKSLQLDKDTTNNIYIVLSKSFGVINKNKSESIDYAEYLQRLRTYTKGMKFTEGSDVEKIINDGETYTSKKISKMYENIILMQDVSASCDFCKSKEYNNGIGIALKVVEPVVDSYLSHHESKIWPKAIGGIFGISYGFNANQKNQVYSLDFRPKIDLLASKRLSVDISLNYHDFGGELGDDDYKSYSVGLVKHNNSMLLQTWGIGFQHETKGKYIYEDDLDSAFIKISVLNELFSLKYLYRLEEVKQYPIQTRDDKVWVLSADISKLCQMVLPNICRL